jgi:hypothetical protein
MLSVDGAVHLSASDLVGHLNCHYLTKLDLAVARGELDKPLRWDPVLEVLVERGALHEQSYLDHLELSGLSITRVDGVGVDASAVEQTLDAMRRGVPIIAQGALRVGRWGGRADVLRRVEKPSELGTWSYEVIDTKLARETKGNTVLQMDATRHHAVPGCDTTRLAALISRLQQHRPLEIVQFAIPVEKRAYLQQRDAPRSRILGRQRDIPDERLKRYP